MALGLVVAGCGKQDEASTKSSASSAAASTTTTSSSAPPSNPPAAADYSALLIKAEALPTPGAPFVGDPPVVNPAGRPGVSQFFRAEDNSGTINDTILLADSAEQAGQILQTTEEGLGASVIGTPAPMPSVKADAAMTAGTSPDGSKAVTVLLFTEQIAVVTIEFDNAPGDFTPVPIDFVEAVGIVQQDAIRTGLPTVSAPGAATPAVAPGPASMTVGGQPANLTGPVDCATTDGKFAIVVGDPVTGVIVGLEPDASAVHNVGIGTFNGAVLAFTEGAPGNEAAATKKGNTYTITGTATGTNSAHVAVSKPFEIRATCP
jgi:lipoprotein LpqH